MTTIQMSKWQIRHTEDSDVCVADAERLSIPQRDGDELVNVASRIPRVADRFSSHWDYNENGGSRRGGCLYPN